MRYYRILNDMTYPQTQWLSIDQNTLEIYCGIYDGIDKQGECIKQNFVRDANNENELIKIILSHSALQDQYYNKWFIQCFLDEWAQSILLKWCHNLTTTRSGSITFKNEAYGKDKVFMNDSAKKVLLYDTAIIKTIQKNTVHKMGSILINNWLHMPFSSPSSEWTRRQDWCNLIESLDEVCIRKINQILNAVPSINAMSSLQKHIFHVESMISIINFQHDINTLSELMLSSLELFNIFKPKKPDDCQFKGISERMFSVRQLTKVYKQKLQTVLNSVVNTTDEKNELQQIEDQVLSTKCKIVEVCTDDFKTNKTTLRSIINRYVLMTEKASLTYIRGGYDIVHLKTQCKKRFNKNKKFKDAVFVTIPQLNRFNNRKMERVEKEHDALLSHAKKFYDHLKTDQLSWSSLLLPCFQFVGFIDALLALKKTKHSNNKFIQPHYKTLNPIRIHLDSKGCAVRIIGANASGKSYFMKTVAITTLFHQCGLLTLSPLINPLISCNRFVSSILFRHPGDLENTNCSSFVNQVLQIRQILHHIDDRSEVCFDEIGVGTSVAEGVKFCNAVVSFILNKYPSCHLFFATHFTDSYPAENTLYCRRRLSDYFLYQQQHSSLDLYNDSMQTAQLYFKDFMKHDFNPSKRRKI